MSSQPQSINQCMLGIDNWGKTSGIWGFPSTGPSLVVSSLWCNWCPISWFNIMQLLSNEIAGHSLWSGGATVLTLAGTPLHQIQGASQWSSDAFLIYLWKNLLLIQGSLTGCSTFDGQQNDHWSSPPATHPPPLLPFSSLWSLCWSAHTLQ